ncbi:MULTISPECIES: hypothetical protein [Thermomonospora]|uniref:DUF1963 domain-containing protein n=1 Tax=Thermomonospora cellulosilytica TaxID=1411118 RepID=A0A7W3MVF7_9ACTN|nr:MULTISPECIES: hypothetical protein [Thermomonospora]MBA9002636.1 hypothetical protein [Thermomonospora cellulosilytica]
MPRTSRQRPVDLVALFPELARYQRTATRLHPRRGNPGVHDSSVGGPLLWPADEPWPVCAGPHHVTDALPVRTAEVRADRQGLMKDQPWDALYLDVKKTNREILQAGPLPLMAVAQIYKRDVPGLPVPDGKDVLQVLWCPLRGHQGHPDDWLNMPALHLVWCRAADVGEVLTEQPEPPFLAYESYLPESCVLHPEEVTEFEYADLLPEPLRTAVDEWDEENGRPYQEWSIADGWKVGGYASWHLTDPYPMICDCGSDMRLLLTIASKEWQGRDGLWRPVEDADADADHRDACTPTKVTIGRGYSLWIFRCPESFDHRHRISVQ